MEVEIWKDIPDYEGLYEASSLGHIRGKVGRVTKRIDFRTGEEVSITWNKVKTLKPKLIKSSNMKYYQINLYKDKISKTHYIHRLIAKTFIPNPKNYPEVNHINGDRLDNRVENLEWVTSKENSKHAVESGLMPFTKGVKLVPINADSEPIIFNTMTKGNKFLGRGNSYLTERVKYHDEHVAISNIDGKKYKIEIMN